MIRQPLGTGIADICSPLVIRPDLGVMARDERFVWSCIMWGFMPYLKKHIACDFITSEFYDCILIAGRGNLCDDELINFTMVLVFFLSSWLINC